MKRNAVFFLFFFLFQVIANQQEDCAAVVEYFAAVRDPNRPWESKKFRGTIRAMFINPALLNEEQYVQWRFDAGEIIDTDKDVSVDTTEDYPEEIVGNIGFTSEIVGETQTVALRFNLTDGNNIARMKFTGYKQSNSPIQRGATSNQRDDQVSLPEWIVVNGIMEDGKVVTGMMVNGEAVNILLCQPAPRLLQSTRNVVQPSEQTSAKSDVLLEYAPRELRRFPYEDNLFPDTTEFSFRLQNTAAEDLNLSDLKVVYWFDGADEEGIDMQVPRGPSEYTSKCLSSNLGCTIIQTEVETGLKNVFGAQYKVVISFPESSKKLRGTRSRNQRDNAVDRLRATIAVTSKRPFSSMDTVVDYSFKDTSQQSNRDRQNHKFIRRSLEPNQHMVVYKKRKPIWGSVPVRGEDKRRVSEIQDGGSFDFLRSDPVRKGSGLKMRYCCRHGAEFLFGDNDNEGTRPEADKERAKETVPIWIFGAIVGAWTFIAVTACFFLLIRRRSNPGWTWLPTTQDAEIGLINQSPFQRHRVPYVSFAWSIDDSALRKSKEAEYELAVPDINFETKYHTVPSISETVRHSLVRLCAQERNDEEDYSLRRSSSWAGCMHWVWEPWDSAAIHCSGPVATSRKKPATFQTATRKIQNIPLNVDYQTEIEPNLGLLLGEGGFGKVFAASWKGRPVAVKLMKVDTEAMYKNLKDEVKMTSRMCHERIVRLLAACLSDKNHICLIMELVENGNLSRRIHNRNLRKLEYLQVLQIGLDVAHGLSYLHPMVIHRDLKPQNVLLDGDNRAKIADFGISKFKDPHRSYLSVTQTGGTPNYMAPELFNGTRVDEKCDIYSLGCILYEAMTRCVPLSDLPSANCAPLFQIIKTVAIDKRRPKIPEFFPHGFAHIIRKCWKDNPRSRPSASEVCKALEKLIDREIDRIEGERKALRDAAFTPRLAERSSSAFRRSASTSSPRPLRSLDDRSGEKDDRHDSVTTQRKRSEHECIIEGKEASSGDLCSSPEISKHENDSQHYCSDIAASSTQER